MTYTERRLESIDKSFVRIANALEKIAKGGAGLGETLQSGTSSSGTGIPGKELDKESRGDE